jgi:hypothetical protein
MDPNYGQQQGYGQQPNYGQPQPQGYGQPAYGQPGYGMAVTPPRDWLLTLLLAIFLGYLGIHRFYAGKIGTGLLMLFTGGGCGIWWLIDVILIAVGSFTDAQGRPLARNNY